MKLYCDSVIIEITRRCNMECAHCLRGAAENKDMSANTMRLLMQTLNHEVRISTLTISGGEPSLNAAGMYSLLGELKRCDADVENVYVFTNAKEIHPDFATAYIMFYAFCSINEMSGMSISDSKFHLDQLMPCERDNKLLSLLVNKDDLDRGGTMKTYLINEGRARRIKESSTVEKRDNYPPMLIRMELCDGEAYLRESDIYLNVHGDIYSNCNLSYATQRKDKKRNIEYYIGNVNSGRTMEAMISDYNKRLIEAGGLGFEAEPSGTWTDSNGETITYYGEDG